MTIYEDDLFEETWSKALEDYEDEICEMIAKRLTDAENEDEYEAFIEDCIREVIDEDTFWEMFDDKLDEATDNISDCEDYLMEYGIEDVVDEYVHSWEWDGSFSAKDCAMWHIKENMNYDYDDFICDVLYGFVEMEEMDCDDEDYKRQNIVNRIKEEYLTDNE